MPEGKPCRPLYLEFLDKGFLRDAAGALASSLYTDNHLHVWHVGWIHGRRNVVPGGLIGALPASGSPHLMPPYTHFLLDAQRLGNEKDREPGG